MSGEKKPRQNAVFRHATTLGGLGFALGLAAVVRLGIMWCVDVQGAFGPDAPGAITAAMVDPFGHPYPLHPLAIAALVPFCSGDPIQAALLVSILSGFATVAACWSMAKTLGGDYAAQATGAVAATAPLLCLVSLLKGGDGLALALASWGVAITWSAASRTAVKNGRDEGVRTGRDGVLLVVGPALVGISAWAKPIALPLSVALVVGFVLGSRRASSWLFVGVLVGTLLASPLLRPLIQPIPQLGLLASWWHPAPPVSVEGLLRLPQHGLDVVLQLELSAPWTMGFALFLLGLAGALGGGPHRKARVLLFVSGVIAIWATAAIVGERLQPRYLAAASMPWTVLTGLALVPRRLRGQARPLSRRRWFDTLALSLVLTLFLLSSMRIWEGIGWLRAQEEGAGAPRGVLRSDQATALEPKREFSDSTVCGSLELARLADRIVEELGEGAIVATVPLRDGRSWHLAGVLAWKRPEIEVLELDGNCCPNTERCAERAIHALSSTGGVIVGPIPTDGRCETGAVSADRTDLVEHLEPLLLDRGLWYGSRWIDRIEGIPEHPRHFCERIGGRKPVLPAGL